jgi:SAM-dependent methyltransferase
MKIKKFKFDWNDQESQKIFESDTVHFSIEQRFKTQAEQLIENFGIQKEYSILDFGCGIGKHAVEVAKRGYQVVGYDISEYYIAQAKELAIIHDVDNILCFYNSEDFIKDKYSEFDFIYSIDFPLGYFDEKSIIRILKCIWNALKKQHFFLFGFAYTRENREKFLPRNKWEEREGIFYLTDENIDNDGQRFERYIVIDPAKETLTEWTDTSKYYYLEEIEYMLNSAGFNVIDKFKSTEKELPETAEDVNFIFCKS